GLTAEESQLINLINSERTSRGLQPIQVDMRIVGTARAKARDMAANRYFSHTSPTLGTPDVQMRNAGITNYTSMGENLALAPSVSQAHTNLMNSEGHRNNILNSRFTHIGLGVIYDSQWGKVVVEQFAGK
ncbi:MAG: CAP domain-containing protein, partial [Desulfocucumaceae bacterium]